MKTSSNGRTRKKDRLCTPIPSSGEGSYASQPCGTRRSTPAMPMEKMIQPQTLFFFFPWLTLMLDSNDDRNQDHETMQVL